MSFELPTINYNCDKDKVMDSNFDLPQVFDNAADLCLNSRPSPSDDILYDVLSAGNATFAAYPDTNTADDTEDDDIEAFNLDDLVRYVGPAGPKPTKCVTPITIMICNTIGLKTSRRILRVLLDSGSMKTLIHEDVLPKGASRQQLNRKKSVTTLGGDFAVDEVVHLRDLRLPEFDKNRCVDETKALVFKGKCRYDVILGADFLGKTGIIINHEKNVCEWLGLTVPMRHANDLMEEDFHAMAESFLVQQEDEDFGEDWLENYATSPVLDAKYEKVEIEDVVSAQTHLTSDQQNDLRDLLSKYTKLFDGTLGCYPHKEFHIDIDETVQPVHSRPYPIAKVNELAFKKELKHLCDIGVLEKVYSATDWSSPSFCQAKKDGRIRFLTDLRQLNKAVKRKVYPLPRIQDVLKKRKGYSFLTKLDISM